MRHCNPTAPEGRQNYGVRREQHRFVRGMKRASHLTDGFALSSTNAGRSLLVVYKEDAASIRLDLSGLKPNLRAVAVDTKKPYAEIDLGALKPESQTWKAPYQSDWAIAVESPK
jgi:hypothetical protein